MWFASKFQPNEIYESTFKLFKLKQTNMRIAWSLRLQLMYSKQILLAKSEANVLGKFKNTAFAKWPSNACGV